MGIKSGKKLVWKMGSSSNHNTSKAKMATTAHLPGQKMIVLSKLENQILAKKTLKLWLVAGCLCIVLSFPTSTSPPGWTASPSTSPPAPSFSQGPSVTQSKYLVAGTSQ